MYHSKPPGASERELSEKQIKRNGPFDPSCPPSPTYPETPQPSSPETQVRPVFLSYPALGTTGINTVVNDVSEYGKCLLHGATLLSHRTPTDGHDQDTAAKSPSRGTMMVQEQPEQEQPSPKKSIHAFTTPRQRRSKKMDPLGTSLHSYLEHEEPPAKNNDYGRRPSAISEANSGVDDQESTASTRKRRLVRDRPSHMRARRSITMPLPPRRTSDSRRSLELMNSSTLLSHDSMSRTDPCEITNNDKIKKFRHYHFRDNPYDPRVTSCSRRAKACHQYTSQSQSLGWAVYLFLVAILCAALFFANEHMQLQFDHQQLVRAHAEKTQLLLAANKQATMFSSNWISGSTAPITQHLFQHHHNPQDGSSENHQHHQQQVQILQKTIQDMAMRSLHDRFPTLLQTGQSTIETQVILEGHESPLLFAIAFENVPYTAWTWLDQVQQGVWDHAQLTHVGEDDFLEIRIVEPATRPATTGATATTNAIPATSGSGTPSTLLSFQEQGFPTSGGDRFVLGLRNPVPVGSTSAGLILTIHLTQGTCGQVDDEEVCFGQVVGGFDSLRMIRAEKQPLSLESIQVQF